MIKGMIIKSFGLKKAGNGLFILKANILNFGENNRFVLRLMLSNTDTMPWDWPVEVNCLESNAYCRWLSSKTG
jgi:hypothetical protein